MPIKTRLCDMLNIEHPIILAPMAGVSGGALAASVSNAGGLGLIGGGYGDELWLKQEFQNAGNSKVGVGFIGWALEHKPELLNLAIDHSPSAIFLSFGGGQTFAPIVKRANLPLIIQVQTLAQAKQALSEGADILVAQGTEAGGHGGQRATFPLVPAIVDCAGDTPVIAAGGIADGRGLAASLMLGAQGVLCGTAFYASREALSHPNAKTAAINGSGDDTLRSSVFDVARGFDWPKDWNLRTLRNAFTNRWNEAPQQLSQNIDQERQQFVTATKQGDTSIAPVIVGEAVDMVARTEDAGTIVKRIAEDAADIINTWAD